MTDTKSSGFRVLRVCKACVAPGAAILAITTLGWGCASSNPITGASGAGGKEGMTLAGSGGRSGTAVGGAGPGIAGSSPGGGGAAGLGSGGTAGAGAANSGGAGNGGGAAGLSGAPNASAGGTQGGAGGTQGGAGGTQGGAGSGGKGSWVEAFNHKDLTNFHPLIHGWKYDDNHYNTFRVDPTTGYLVNSLADYPGGAKGYGGHCGLLYYDQNLTDYRFRIEYQFLPDGDGNNNGGMEVFCQDPSKVTGDPTYAPGLEIQVIAQCTNGCGGGTTKAGDGSNNLSICQPTNVKASTIMGDPNARTTNCTPGSSAKLPPQAQWVTIECEIHPGSASKCWDCWEGAPTASTPFPGCTPDVTQPAAIAFSGVHDNSGPLKGGYFAAVQSEGQEQAYRTIQVMDLSQ